MRPGRQCLSSPFAKSMKYAINQRLQSLILSNRLIIITLNIRISQIIHFCEFFLNTRKYRTIRPRLRLLVYKKLFILRQICPIKNIQEFLQFRLIHEIAFFNRICS